MDLVEDLYKHLAKTVCGNLTIPTWVRPLT